MTVLPIMKDYGNCSSCGHSWKDHNGADFSGGELGETWSNTICSHKECNKGDKPGAFHTSDCWWFEGENEKIYGYFE